MAQTLQHSNTMANTNVHKPNRNHIEYVYKKLLRFIGMFYKFRDQVNMDVLRMIFFCIYTPTLTI